MTAGTTGHRGESRGGIQLTLLNYVAERYPEMARQTAIPHGRGLTVGQLLGTLGMAEAEIGLVIVNGAVRGMDQVLEDGDRVVLSAVVGGG